MGTCYENKAGSRSDFMSRRAVPPYQSKARSANLMQKTRFSHQYRSPDRSKFKVANQDIGKDPDQPGDRHVYSIDCTKAKAKSLSLNSAFRQGGGIPGKAAQWSSYSCLHSHVPAP